MIKLTLLRGKMGAKAQKSNDVISADCIARFGRWYLFPVVDFVLPRHVPKLEVRGEIGGRNLWHAASYQTLKNQQ